MKLQFPCSFANRLEMLRQIEHQEEEKRALREEGETERQQKDQEISNLRNKAVEKEEENVRLTQVYSSEVEQLKLHIQDLKSQKQLLVAKSEYEVTELQTKVAFFESQIENNDILLPKIRMLEDEILRKDSVLSRKDAELSRKDTELSINVATIRRKESVLEANAQALRDKDAIISGMSEQLTRAREHLSSCKQPVSSEVLYLY